MCVSEGAACADAVSLAGCRRGDGRLSIETGTACLLAAPGTNAPPCFTLLVPLVWGIMHCDGTGCSVKVLPKPRKQLGSDGREALCSGMPPLMSITMLRVERKGATALPPNGAEGMTGQDFAEFSWR